MFENVGIALPLLDGKAVNSTIFKNSLNTYRNILCYLLIYCLVQQCVYQSRVHDVEEPLDIRHGFQQSAVYSAMDRERLRLRTGERQWRREGCKVQSHRAATCRGGTLTRLGNFF